MARIVTQRGSALMHTYDSLHLIRIKDKMQLLFQLL